MDENILVGPLAKKFVDKITRGEPPSDPDKIIKMEIVE